MRLDIRHITTNTGRTTVIPFQLPAIRPDARRRRAGKKSREDLAFQPGFRDVREPEPLHYLDLSARGGPQGHLRALDEVYTVTLCEPDQEEAEKLKLECYTGLNKRMSRRSRPDPSSAQHPLTLERKHLSTTAGSRPTFTR